MPNFTWPTWPGFYEVTYKYHDFDFGIQMTKTKVFAKFPINDIQANEEGMFNALQSSDGDILYRTVNGTSAGRLPRFSGAISYGLRQRTNPDSLLAAEIVSVDRLD